MPGSDLLLRVIQKDDPRPVYIVVNAGSDTLAQAIIDFEREHSKDELKQFISKLRVYENAAQDNAGAWICANYPEIHWILSLYQKSGYGGPFKDGIAENKGSHKNLGSHTWEPYEYSRVGQHQWVLKQAFDESGMKKPGTSCQAFLCRLVD